MTWERVDLRRGLIGLTAGDTKNKKPRTVPLTPELAEVFRDLDKVRYLGQDRVFLRNGQAIRSVRKAFEKAKQRAGVDVMTAMRIIGHTSQKTYMRYNTIDEHDLRRAASQTNTYITLAQKDAESIECNPAI